MPKIKFINADNSVQEIEAEAGTSLMQAAMDNNVEGILAECGGACSCATCHCYIEPAWMDKAGDISEVEKDMLDCVLEPQTNSRLSCQVTISDDMDGIEIHIPESQY
jgi:2Fe-2S ferredoxin